MAVRRADCLDDLRDAGDLGQSRFEPLSRLRPDRRRCGLSAPPAQLCGAGRDVRREACDGRVARGDATGEQGAQLAEAGAGARGDHEQRRLAKPVGREEPRRVLAPRRHVVRGEQVCLVQDDRHRVGVGSETPEIAVVERGVGVLLRLDDPDEEVGQLDHPVDLQPVRRLDRVEVRQVEKHEALELRALRGGDAA